MTDLKISAADARLILVAIDKLPPSFYSTEACKIYGPVDDIWIVVQTVGSIA